MSDGFVHPETGHVAELSKQEPDGQYWLLPAPAVAANAVLTTPVAGHRFSFCAKGTLGIMTTGPAAAAGSVEVAVSVSTGGPFYALATVVVNTTDAVNTLIELPAFHRVQITFGVAFAGGAVVEVLGVYA